MSKHRFTCVQKRNWEKLTLRNCYSINFGLEQKKTWTFSKTVKHDFQNCSPRVQGNKFRSFSEGKKFVWNFSDFEREGRTSCEKFYSGLPKAHFACPVQHSEKKIMKVNFTFCGLFTTLSVILQSDRKVSRGCQTHKLSVQR